MKTDLFQFCGHCWVFQICWHIEYSTFKASSFRVWNSSTEIPSPPLALFIVMLPKAHLTSHFRMSGEWSHNHDYLGHEDLFCSSFVYFWNSHKDQHSSPQVQRKRHLRRTLLGSGTWDPLLQCLYLDKFLLSRKNTNCKRLKITVYMHSSGKLWKTRYKKARNPAATSEVSRAKSRVLCMVPAHSTTKGGEQTTQATPLTRPMNPPLPSPHLRNQLALLQGMSKGTCFLFLLPLAAAQVPVKLCLNFSSGLFISCYGLHSPGTCR